MTPVTGCLGTPNTKLARMPKPVPEPADAPPSPEVGKVGDERRPPTGALRALLGVGPDARDDSDGGTVRIVDTPEERVRHPSDVLAIVLYALGIVLVLFAAVYAHSTTIGVAEDVQGFDELLSRVLFIPVTVLSGLVTLIIPTAVLIELGMRRLGRQVVEAIAAAALGLALGLVMSYAIRRFGTDHFVQAFSVWRRGSWDFTMPGYVTAIGGLLTAAGSRARRRTVAWSWNLLLITVGILLITGQVSLPGVLVTVLLGRIAGLAVRYASGVRSERAYGPDLVAAVHRAGFHPSALVRVRDITDSTALAEATEDPITEVNAEGEITGSIHVGVLRDPTSQVETALTADADLAARHLGGSAAAVARSGGRAVPAAPSDPAAIALTRSGDNRVYAMFDNGRRHDVVVLDGDRQVVGFLVRAWRSIRLRGLERRAAISLRSVAERAALLSYAATTAGVRTPRLLGVGSSVDSMVLVTEHAEGAISLRDLPQDQVTEAVLAECWRQLTLAHASGLAHRALTSDVVLVAGATARSTTGEVGTEEGQAGPQVWLTGWDQGDIASSTLAQRMDVTQMIALLALRVGATRAVESAARILADEHIAAIGPLLQSVTLPSSTRQEMRLNKKLLKELRAALLSRLPEADIEPLKLNRFSARTILTLTLTIVAVTVVVTTINFQEIAAAVTKANALWVVASFTLGLLTWVGAALAFVAFSPVKLPMWRITLVQAAASFVGLAVPAGIGPAAINLRVLTRRGTSTPMAVATVALVQVAQFVVTIALLLVLSIATSNSNLIKLPSTTILLTIAVIALIVVAVLLVPVVRTWLLGKIRPTAEQVWPRLSQMLSQPGRLALGLAGNLIVTLGYILAFDAALRAFDQHLSLVNLSVIYLASNAIGSATPVPGGIGIVEGALATSLIRLGGVAIGLAWSIAVLFRVTTFWVRIPIGWIAMRYLQRVGEL